MKVLCHFCLKLDYYALWIDIGGGFHFGFVNIHPRDGLAFTPWVEAHIGTIKLVSWVIWQLLSKSEDNLSSFKEFGAENIQWLDYMLTR